MAISAIKMFQKVFPSSIYTRPFTSFSTCMVIFSTVAHSANWLTCTAMVYLILLVKLMGQPAWLEPAAFHELGHLRDGGLLDSSHLLVHHELTLDLHEVVHLYGGGLADTGDGRYNQGYRELFYLGAVLPIGQRQTMVFSSVVTFPLSVTMILTEPELVS